MVSFDVESLFTNVPLEETIDIILHKIYRESMIVTNITENDIKSLLFLCTLIPASFLMMSIICKLM